jgi:uncharacterized protein (UPF0332 family)
MVNVKWCLKVKNGLELVESNLNMVESYLKMGNESLDELKNVNSKIWVASTAYYAMYYSLYALMMKIGVKCEVHSCSIDFMDKFLGDFYNEEDVKFIRRGFKLRNDLQYYPDRLVSSEGLDRLRKESVDFFLKTKEIISKISESQIKKIRGELKGYGK